MLRIASGPQVADLRGRFGTPLAVALTIVLLAFAASELVSTLQGSFGAFVDYDRGHYVDAARRWIETGTPYLPNDVAGRFVHERETFLHPPISLYLFTPFIVIPPIVWWIVPLGIVAAAAVWWRPSPWAWPILALIAWWPRTIGAVIVGNSDMWVAAFVALALLWGWAGVLVLIKPSYLPLALIDLRRRRWWIAVVILGLAALPFGTLWLDWFSVVRNAPADFTYSIPALPLVLLPVVAWAARTRADRHSSRQPAAA